MENSYLGTTSIVHPCAHTKVGPQHKNKETMSTNAGTLIKRLILAILPYALFHIMLEGIALWNKMNQHNLSVRHRAAADLLTSSQ